MLPVYNRIVREFEDLCKQFYEALIDSDSNSSKSYFLAMSERAVKKYAQAMCLRKLGFMSSIQRDLQDYEALTIAHYYGLLNEVRNLMDNKISPTDALAELNIL